jgi:hypothetical protein
VVIVSRSPDRLATAAHMLPANVSSKTLDVTDAGAVQRFFEDGGEWDHIVVAGSATNVGPVRSFALEEGSHIRSASFSGAERSQEVDRLRKPRVSRKANRLPQIKNRPLPRRSTVGSMGNCQGTQELSHQRQGDLDRKAQGCRI